MTEYWISKKQYWCKYCSIWIRDDAPSRRQHETGLRHIGAKERFIRDLYKTGSIAKRDKEQEAQEMARINAAAEAAHAQDTGTAGPSRKAVMYTQNHRGPSATSGKPAKSGDKFANYSTASQLGLVEEDEALPSTFEIEQMVRNQDTRIGQWEEVVNEPTGLYSGEGVKTEHGADEEAETEGWKFQHKGKRPVRDPYDDDDFDPSAILKMRKKVKQDGEPPVPMMLPTPEELAAQEGALDRGKWSGKIELKPATSPPKRAGLVYQKGGGWVKVENANEGPVSADRELKIKPDVQERERDQTITQSRKPDIEGQEEEDSKPALPDLISDDKGEDTPKAKTIAPESSGGLFKKRRPPPSSRKK